MKKKILFLVLCIAMLVVAVCAIPVFAAGTTESDQYPTYTDADVPSTLASAKFVLFKSKGNQLSETTGHSTLKDAVNKARGWNNTWTKVNNVNQDTYGHENRSSYILLRGDYTTTTNDKFDNWAQGMNTITIDLNGHTITQGEGTEALFARATSKGSSSQGYIFDTKYVVKNGHLAVSTDAVLSADVWDTVAKVNGYTIADKDFTWNFENVTFEYVASVSEGKTKTSSI